MVEKGRHFGIGGAGNQIIFDKKPRSIRYNRPSALSYIPLGSETDSISDSTSPKSGFRVPNHTFQIRVRPFGGRIRSTLRRTGSSIARKTRSLLKTDYDGIKHESGFFGGVGWCLACTEGI